MFEENTKRINRVIANLLATCSAAVLLMTLLSVVGMFEFGTAYTLVTLIVGLFVSVAPKLLIGRLPENVMKYYMMATGAVYIGLLGTNAHIGIYITYALMPIFSCLYFDPPFVLQTCAFSYAAMLTSLFVRSKTMLEVVYQGRPRMQMFGAYALGFTIEFAVVAGVLYYLVKRAKKLMLERYSAEEQNRMKSVFLSNVSHEIRTPMNAIIGMTDVARQMEMDDKLRRCLNIIHASAAGLLEVVNDILDFSKVEAGKWDVLVQPYSPRAMMEDMRAIIDARNDGHVEIAYHVAPDMPEALEGDAGRIRQVMLNYASNAIKYTEKGHIDIDVRCEAAEAGQVNLLCDVTDTGQGIRSEDMDKLFTMYGQINRELNRGKEGTGIGLALSKSIMERMHGSVKAESEYGKGSRFSFCVPQKIGRAEDLPCEERAKRAPAFTAKGARLLLVDDNEINREVAKAILEPLQMEIDEAADGWQAVEMSAKTAYDMILMDSHMPVMSGEEATRAIREREKTTGGHVPVIALTADAICGVKQKLMEAGMDDYIEKPIDSALLMRILQKYICASQTTIAD